MKTQDVKSIIKMQIRKSIGLRIEHAKKSQDEHGIQSECVRWFTLKYPKYVIMAVPNSARRSARMGAWMKQEGLLAGASDLIIIIPHNVIFIEMKKEKGRQQQSQKEFQSNVERLGFRYEICRSVTDFIKVVENWIKECTSI